MPNKKRKFSDLSTEQTSRVMEILLSCREAFDQLGIDENDEGVIDLNNIIDKLKNAKHTPFSDVSLVTLAKMGVKIQPMEWRSNGETEAKAYGRTTLSGAISVEETKKKISDVFKLVSLESEAGCRILIDTLLIHVVSNLETEKFGAVIAPEFRIESRVLERTENSFGGVVDYMLAYGDKTARDRIIKSKAFAFSDPEIYKMLQCNIYEAKPEDLFTPTTSLPQAAIAAIIKAQDLRLKTFRGCVSSGKRWVFFVYSAENPGHGQGKTVYWLDAIPLGERHDPIVNLELILGILRDWVSLISVSQANV
ncbi:hypothetical protein H0H81_011754 [Sphagnurus paluster]|uniref:Uncharacterized protein n=1 Tax=Sphagnurus paluster TaxID=117069 RepID=A0A9P7KKG1_9AGAR|nr:hypothetical protein H0H81_011754 [Sphagnurus paluster]